MEKLLIKDRAIEFKHAPDTIRAYFDVECPMESPIQGHKGRYRGVEIQTIANPGLWETYGKISVGYYQDQENFERHGMDKHETVYYKGINEAMEAIRSKFHGYEIEIDEDLQKKFDYFNIKALPYNKANEMLLSLCGEFGRRERKALETLETIVPVYDVPEGYTTFNIIGSGADFQITKKPDGKIVITN